MPRRLHRVSLLGLFRVAAESPADTNTEVFPTKALTARAHSRTKHDQITSLFEDLETLAKLLTKVNVPQIKAVSERNRTTFQINRFEGTPKTMHVLYGQVAEGADRQAILSSTSFLDNKVDLALPKQ